jgi:hypothetical protein
MIHFIRSSTEHYEFGRTMKVVRPGHGRSADWNLSPACAACKRLGRLSFNNRVFGNRFAALTLLISGRQAPSALAHVALQETCTSGFLKSYNELKEALSVGGKP